MNKKQQLVDLLIHDLTGPLSIISTSTNNLLKKEGRYGKLTEQQKKAITMILRNATKAQTFLHDIIEIYRSEEGLLRKEPLSIKAVLKEALIDAIEIIEPQSADELSCIENDNNFNDILQKQGIHINIDGKYSRSPFLHDHKKVQQIIRNLITNALKYRQKQIKIRISGEHELIVSVEDDGAGIPIEKQAYIFKRFFDIKEKGKTDERGLGFGLSCVKALVESMNGIIELTSGEGKGTNFTVHIPPL